MPAKPSLVRMQVSGGLFGRNDISMNDLTLLAPHYTLLFMPSRTGSNENINICH